MHIRSMSMGVRSVSMGVRYLLRDNMSSLMTVGSLDDFRIGTGAYHGLMYGIKME